MGAGSKVQFDENGEPFAVFLTVSLFSHPHCRRRPFYLDHQMINDIPPFTDLNPLAENLARYFFDEIEGQVVKNTANRVTVKRCTIYETDRFSETHGR